MNKALLTLLAVLSAGCAMSRAATPTLQPYALSAPAQVLEENHFSRDRMGVGEAELRQILAAPIFLEEHARIGVLPVSTGYAPDGAVPVETAPATLTAALEGSGLFDLASEISADWPSTSGTAGLRELAARYRTEYVLLYRHRFEDATRPNGFAAGFITLIGAFVLPGTTIESEGVLEATLFDVKTGTILFTVNERVRQEKLSLPTNVPSNLADMHRAMISDAARKLSDQVLLRCQRLVATRPANAAPVAELIPST
ncbi:MAG: hypothetical protein Q8N23_03540 [Archangium sp.]|nr:hypothetical protein [Archangium sp.]MDP3573235.1 hypothetical protein [Archangium sp.]